MHHRMDWTRVIVAGLVGTVVFDVVGFLLTAMMGTPTWWDVPRLLGMKTNLGLAAGVFQHYGNGVILSILFAALAPHLWGPVWFRVLFYITVQTVFGVWLFMMPLLDMGIAGLKSPMGMMAPVGSILRHWGYGLVLAFLVPVPEAVPSPAPERAGL
ncbi:hypothetical protein HRbin11_01916 [bacterium HR11]|nr:hypothetical protein HRbin11_01916 [bacterium HR11]